MRWTTELIGATVGTRMAPGATSHVANWATSSIFSTWEWCFSNNVRNMNRSWRFDTYVAGGLSASDMAQDYYVKAAPYPVITLAAGNCNDDCSTNCTTQTNKTVANRSLNALIVGGSDDKNTASTSDDTMVVYSPYVNPQTTHNDFELPNLVAPALGIDSASVSNFCGTSGAAPQVLGTAMLIKTRDTTYYAWPEGVRATLLAASTHPVDSGTRTTTIGGSDLKQGAGLLNANSALTIADPDLHLPPGSSGVANGHYAKTYNFSTDFTNGLSNDAYNIYTNKTGRLRAVIAFDSSASGCSTTDGSGCTGDVLDADLDLQLSKWNSSTSQWDVVCDSASFDSSWELCDVTTASLATYQIRIIKNATNAASTYVGVAWSNYDTGAE